MKLAFVVGGCLMFGLGLAQKAISTDTLHLSQAELHEQLNARNLQLKAAQAQVTAAQAEYRQSAAVFLPQIAVSQQNSLTTNPLMAFGSVLNQAQVTPAHFDPNALNHPSATRLYGWQVQVVQPLVQPEGWMGRRAAQAQWQAQQFQTQRQTQLLHWQANQMYRQLQLLYHSQRLWTKALQAGQAQLKRMEHLQQQGLVQPADVLLVALRVNTVKQQQWAAQQALHDLSDQLRVLMGVPPGPLLKPQLDASFSVALSTPAESAPWPSQRADLQAMQAAETAYKYQYKAQQYRLLPTVAALGNYQWYDTQWGGFGASGYTVGVQLQWNVWDGGASWSKTQQRKAQWQKAQADQQNYQLQAEAEWRKAQRALGWAQEQVVLKAQAEAQAAEVYRMRQNRHAQGLEKTADLLQAEAQYYEAAWIHQQAQTQYDLQNDYLQFLAE